MLIVPAIDIIGGKCVRLTKGDYSTVKEYFEDPLAVALKFRDKGFSFLHVVDLEGARNGCLVNSDVILKIAKEIGIQVGGGIRKYGDAAKLLNEGVKKVVIGTSVFENPRLVRDLVRDFGSDRVIVSIDIKNEEIMTRGWKENSSFRLEKVLEELKSLGVVEVIFTDIERDGMLDGVNFEFVRKVAGCGFKVMIAGGVSCESDIEKLSEFGVDGCVVGKAFYEGFLANNLAKRIVPCMDIKNGRVVKGINFTGLKDAGDPVELGKYYSANGADELIFLDIMATCERRETLYDLVRRIAENINIPFTVGGGVTSLSDIRTLLKSGADKVSIGSFAIKNPDFIKEASRQFGSQCIVISLDPKRISGRWKLFVNGGRVETEVDAVEFAKQMEKCGAGELLVNSLDRDGMKNGYDLELLKAITDSVNIPVIASSGAGTKEDFLEAFGVANVDAVLAASLFHYREVTILELKKYLNQKCIPVRI
jgi:cyclase